MFMANFGGQRKHMFVGEQNDCLELRFKIPFKDQHMKKITQIYTPTTCKSHTKRKIGGGDGRFRQTDKQTDRRGRYTDKSDERGGKTERETDRQGRRTDESDERQTDRQTGTID